MRFCSSNCRVLEVLGHQLVHVLDAGMDVRLGLVDVADLELGAGRGHDLHHADRADVALRILVERRLLVALRRQHERIEAVLLRRTS